MAEMACWMPYDKVVNAELKADQEGSTNMTPFDCYRRERYAKLLTEVRNIAATLDSEKTIQENANSDFGATHFVQGDPLFFPIFAKWERGTNAIAKLICYGKLAFGVDKSVVCKCEDGTSPDELIEFVSTSPNTPLMIQEVELCWGRPVKWPVPLQGVKPVGEFGQGGKRFIYYELANKSSGQKYMIRIGGEERCRRGETFQNVQIYRNRDPFPNLR
uniref:Tudor domain-containing protein n=1 Tax=Globodera pallida TaxID=36090 RepID=A0A183C1C7_GLOPA